MPTLLLMNVPCRLQKPVAEGHLTIHQYFYNFLDPWTLRFIESGATWHVTDDGLIELSVKDLEKVAKRF